MLCKKCDKAMLGMVLLFLNLSYVNLRLSLFLHICCYLFMHSEMDKHIPKIFDRCWNCSLTVHFQMYTPFNKKNTELL